jgi:glycosyltransferase involved in cell wall biosynthesis
VFARALLPPPQDAVCIPVDDGAQTGADIRNRLGLEDKIVLGFAGFVRAGQGLEWALRALPRLSPDVHLLVVGDGPARDDLEDQAAFLGIADRTHFVGRMPPGQIPAFVQSFDISLQTRAVGFVSPLKMFEHMSRGRAILAPNEPNLRTVLKPGVDALFFDPQNEASFFSALRQLCADAGLRTRLSRPQPRPAAPVPFNWTENARRMEEAARELLALGADGANLDAPALR